MKTDLENFLAKFPDNASNWTQATDEIRDLARTAKEYYNEIDLDLTQTEVEEGQGLQPLDFRAIKTPAEWNSKGKAYILSTFDLMSERTKIQFMERFNAWLCDQ